MPDQSSLFYQGGGRTLGRVPRYMILPPKGYMTLKKMMGYMLTVPHVRSTMVRTGWNEITYKMDGDLIVQFGFMRIFTLNQNTLELETHGYNTTPTRRHIQSSMRAHVHPECKVTGTRATKGMCVTIPGITDNDGVSFQSTGKFNFNEGFFYSDLGFRQSIGGLNA